LPQVITFGDGRGVKYIRFVYDATGIKLRKITRADDNGGGISEQTTDYVNGIEYKNGITNRIAHSEGAVILQDNGTYSHEFVLRDHLGNTRVTFPDKADGVVKAEDIKQINHYYPFGLNMEGNWNGAASANKYQYNGKEWNDDFGLGWNDYGARFYDPSVSRWVAVDPLAEGRLFLSPYQYVQNSPIRRIDPTGMSDVSRPDNNMEFKENPFHCICEKQGESQPDDWVHMSDGTKIWHEGTISAEDAQAKYGSEVEKVTSGIYTYDDAANRTVVLNSDGTWNFMQKETALGNAVATADKYGTVAGTLAGTWGIAATELAEVTDNALIGVTQRTFSLIGKVSGFIGVSNSVLEAWREYDSTGKVGLGSFAKIAWNGALFAANFTPVGLVSKIANGVSIVDGIMDVTGLKNQVFKF
jgi:RHS repeat-associated protein